MTADFPDVTGYPLEEAREMLSAAGVEAVEVARVGRPGHPVGERRTMVIRQRPGEDNGVELTVASEWRTPIRQDG
ncbi:MAG: PASTA domain-containing protein [Armatimonadota bacterium]